MPIEEKELDEIVGPNWRNVINEMEKGKFYSINEMSEKIIGKRLFEQGVLKEYLPAPYKGKRFAPNEEVLSAIVVYLTDMAFVESFLVTHVALGNFLLGRKNRMPYFAKK